MDKITSSQTARIIEEVIKNRRAIFPVQFTGEKIEDEVITRLLECARWAPTHKITEPWFFHVFSEGGLERLSEYMAEYYKTHTDPDAYSEIKFKKTRNKALLSSHVIAICMKRDPKERIPEWEEIAAVACSVQNMWLLCSALGLGCYWSSAGSALNAGAFLNLGEGERCLGWFYIGVPKDDLTHTPSRSPIAEKIRWHRPS